MRVYTLDIAALYRADLTVPLAFQVARRILDHPDRSIERELRYEAAKQFRQRKVIPEMIDRIKDLLSVDDSSSDS